MNPKTALIELVALLIAVILLRIAWRQSTPKPDFETGQRVRLVRMDGCMAHIRGDVKSGTVVELLKSTPYGTSQELPFIRIVMDDGTIDERVALRSLWTLHDGCLEYRY